MKASDASKIDRLMAQVCRGCPVCRQARRNPDGVAGGWVRKVEGRLCPFCRAYRRVYGRSAGGSVESGP